MNIREAQEKDLPAIRDLHLRAFGSDEGEPVSQLAVALHADSTAKPILSLVAMSNDTHTAGETDEIVGNIIFSAVTIKGDQEEGAYILCPLAVNEDDQQHGIGSQLIKRGFELLQQRSAKYVFVLGDPKYYSKFGFKACEAINPPYELPYPEAWQVLELEDGVLEGVTGTAQCAACLSYPELW